ncbi:MAG TPA: hypothetical protein VFV98_14805 [Vicinamibacterales bacterium]|nr:hypothetical protein [Vicinamibacterales bacterium]
MNVVRALLIVVVAAVIVVAAFTGPLAFMGVLGLAGGSLIAVILHWKLLDWNLPPSSTDPFAGRGPTEIVNMSSVRVTGIGGFGLVVMAFAMAFQFYEVALLMANGIIGGIIIAVILRRRRLRHGIFPSSGDRGNGVLFAGRTEDAPVEDGTDGQLRYIGSGLTAQGSVSRH